MRKTSFGSTATETPCGALPSLCVPYTTPGMRPDARSRRDSFFPLPSRFTASSVASIALPIDLTELKPGAANPLSYEERRDGRLLVNVANRLSEQPRHRQDDDLLARAPLWPERHG